MLGPVGHIVTSLVTLGTRSDSGPVTHLNRRIMEPVAKENAWTFNNAIPILAKVCVYTCIQLF